MGLNWHEMFIVDLSSVAYRHEEYAKNAHLLYNIEEGGMPVLFVGGVKVGSCKEI